ncbi:MAG: HAD hydrolase family protein [Candidatus Omnitrophica bacterium]|nr:HAD hydrolase family protein [Candidatus Omnitrophota bacterium]
MKNIKAVALDVDGVLTDGTFIWGPEGEEFKQFSFLDIMGISRASKAGLIFALISGEDTPLVDRYARKMGIVDVYKGSKDKAASLKVFAQKNGLALEAVCFMGDDINDIEALDLAGLSAVPASAHPAAIDHADLVMKASGGRGAVRELLDILILVKSKGIV